eukprot:TRINITY_DN19356_c0_g1_i1.p1 TRINITY_DN19356_c0_g1~~TRINITY_DN19356_c0_g1_i1.p1  ORF type:complete len:1040 (+),score=135.10 TRINITY_DN19356_c0_g1_i1:151-3270(+)
MPALAVAQADRLSPEDQKKLVDEASNHARVNAKAGDAFYMITVRWWRAWTQSVEQNSKKADHEGLWNASTVAPRPPQIDNSELLEKLPLSETDATPKLKDRLEEDVDYVLVPEAVWKLLQEWYGGGPAIVRNTISTGGPDDTVVEVYPYRLHLVMPGRSETTTITMSRRAKSSEVLQQAKAALGIQHQDVRIWDYFGKQKHKLLTDDQTLEDARLVMDSLLLLEEKTASGWPPELETPESNTQNNSKSLAIVQVPEQAPLRSIAGGGLPSKSSTPPASSSTSWPASWFSGNSHKAESDGGGVGSSLWGGSSSSQNKDGPLGLLGLSNLGNTCFMNSALQCLVHTAPLKDFFMGDYASQINTTNVLGMKGLLATEFAELLRKLWGTGGGPVAPRAFKGTLAKFAPQFSGYNQHDSQELLAFLLDGLHEDLNRVHRKPYVEAKDADGRPDEEVASEYWLNHKARNDSVIVDTCQGQYKSTLVCPVCGKVSITFDPFMYLSLPLPAKTTRSMTVTVISSDGSRLPETHTLNISRVGKVRDLHQALGKACGLGADETFIFVEIYNNRVFRYFLGENESVSIVNDGDRLVAYRVQSGVKDFLVVQQRRYEPSGLHTESWKLFVPPLLVSAPPGGFHEGADLYKRVKAAVRPFFRAPPEPMETVVPASNLPNGSGKVYSANGLLTGGDSRDSDAAMAVDFSQESASEESTAGKTSATINGFATSSGAASERTAMGADARQPSGDREATPSGNHPPSLQEDLMEADNVSAGNDGVSDSRGGEGGWGADVVMEAEENTKHEERFPFKIMCAKGKYDVVDTAVEADKPYCGPQAGGLSSGISDARCVSLDWSAEGLALYDLRTLEKLPEVLKPFQQPMKNKREGAVTLFSCLEGFLKEEPLGPDDMWYCPSCKTHRQASKKLDLWRLPEVLVVHLKRFSYSRYLKNKLDTQVNFPVHDLLDLTNYSRAEDGEPALYELYAVSNHYGGMGGGHYTAYCKLESNSWHNFDDSHVSTASEDDILTSAAYVLFYRRRRKQPTTKDSAPATHS